MSSPPARNTATPQHCSRDVSTPAARPAGEVAAAARPARPRFHATPPPRLPTTPASAAHNVDDTSRLTARFSRSSTTVLPAATHLPTAPSRPLLRSSSATKSKSPPESKAVSMADAAHPNFFLTPLPSKPSASHVHLTIRDGHSDTDVSVSVSLSRKGSQPSSTLYQHIQPAATVSAAPVSSTASRSILSSSVFGHGRWSVCSHVVVAGVLVTLLLALVTIPLLMLRMEAGAGGTDMQRHHGEDEEHGTQHVLRWPKPTAAASVAVPASPSDSPAQPIVGSIDTPVPTPASPSNLADGVPAPPADLASLHPTTLPTSRADTIRPTTPIALRPVDTSLTMDAYQLPRYSPDTLPATFHNLTLYTTFSPTYQHIPSTFPLRTWTLLFPSAPAHLLVYTPDDATCEYVTATRALAVTCVSLPLCFDERSKRKRRKPNKGSLWWEHDPDSRREAKIVCLLKDVDRRADTPLVGYFDHEMLLTEDVAHALHAVINARVVARAASDAPLTVDELAAIHKQPFMLIGRTWEVDTGSRPRMSWKRQGDDAAAQKKKKAAKQPVEPEESDGDYQARLVLNRQRLHEWLSDVRAASLLSQHEYASTFPWPDDAAFLASHNTHPLHWYIYLRTTLPLHAISKSSYLNDGGRTDGTKADDDELPRLTHGWESFVAWAAKSKAVPPVQLVDVSDVVHIMHALGTAAHNHSEHAPPPSLLVFPDGANASEVARLTAAGNPIASNPIAVPLSPGNAQQRLQCGAAFASESCELIEHTDEELDALIESSANADRQLVLLLVNADYLPLAYNWLCRARELSLVSYLFVAEDRISYFSLLSRNVPVTLVHYARHRKPSAFTHTNSSWLFDETSYYRARVLQRAHTHHNLSVLLLHLDTVLFDNPLPLLLPNPHACDVLVPMNGSFPSGGLFYFPVTPLGRRLVRDLVGCEEENVQFAHVYGGNRFVFSDDKDATCLFQLTKRLTSRYQLRRCTFDPLTFPSEADFFGRATPQRAGVWPMAAHVEQQRSVEGKERVMREWRLWRWVGYEADADAWTATNGTTRESEDERLLHPIAVRWRQQRAERWPDVDEQAAYVSCLPTPAELNANLLPAPAQELEQRVVHLHLLAHGDNQPLQATLASLRLVVPVPTLSIHLHVDVSAHSVVSNARPAAANVSHLLLDLEALQWRHGHKYVRQFRQTASMDAEWVRSWPEVKLAASSNDTRLNASVLCLAMQAGQLISPHAFVLLDSLLTSHSLHLDTHLLSIALLHHPHILGETPTWRYGSRTVASLVSATVPAYLYQLSSLSGSVFFLSTIVRLLRFHDDHIASLARLSNSPVEANSTLWPSTFPCVPSMVSNKWYLTQPAAHFDQYLHRFSFDHGLYTLHLNLRGSHAGLLASHNSLCTADDASTASADDCHTPLVLLADDPLQSAVSTRVALLAESVQSSTFPSLSRMPLYDFQFNSVDVELSVLARRSSMFAPHNPFDRTLGTAADDPSAEDDIRAHLVEDEVEDDEKEEEEAPLGGPNALGAAGTAEQVVRERVRRQVNATEAQNINALIRTIVSADQRTRKLSVPAANNPLGFVYPGSLQDRCFVLGGASDVWQDEEDVEMRVRPYIPPATHPAYGGLVAHHQQLVEAQTALLSSSASARAARVLVYKPDVAEGVPLDRQLRGLYFAFVLSLCLQRMFVVDMPAMLGVYDSPTTQPWHYAAYRAQLHSLRSQDFNVTHAQMLRSANLDEKLDAPVVLYRDLISHDRQLLSNPRYRWLPPALFSSQSRVERTGQVMRYLLSCPSVVLVREAAALMDVLHLSAQGGTKAVMAVRLDFADDVVSASAEQPLPNVTAHYLNCVQSMLSTLAAHPNATRLLFSTNRPTRHTYEAVSRLLSPFGAVVTYADNLKRLKGRVGRLLTGGGEDDAAAVTLSAEVLLGYVLGEMDAVVMTDTTFGVFSTARNGYNNTRQYTVLVTEETKAGGAGYCGPIRRLDRPKRMDIVY